ncbi:MAG TPA: 4-hydroxybenzoate 3-monooxygenase [Acetobacteraceae bacterium]|jgi:p-hydroxybenzoate 3-monooxygenase|nr:4-hydroxybenzoate 3-monooxygenase [Acetobacteraceae bacterium]
MRERTQVGIVGAGPAGLLLSHLLHLAGIDSVILEARSRAHVEQRIRAGVLEHEVAALLVETGVGTRLLHEGLPHHGTQILFDGRLHRIDFSALTGKHVTVYSQHNIVQDLIAARLASGGRIVFDAEHVLPCDFAAGSPLLRYHHGGAEHTLDCDIVAGCDGFHGVCRGAMPDGHVTTYERQYPFGWLGILAETRPASDELIYASHARGFALLSMRSPTIGRLYLQCAPDEDLAAWSDARIWKELRTRLACEGVELEKGPVLQKGVTAMRGFVAEPMQCGRMFLAGDAAHIVPPTGAKGLNAAVADVVRLSRGMEAHLLRGDDAPLARYSEEALQRIWKVQRFSAWMTGMLHRFPHASRFDRRVQRAELDALTASPAASTWLAENYVGLPLA